MTSPTIAPIKLHALLTVAETNARYPRDCRQVIRDERETLGLALQSGEGARIASASREALRVAEMWGVEIEVSPR